MFYKTLRKCSTKCIRISWSFSFNRNSSSFFNHSHLDLSSHYDLVGENPTTHRVFFPNREKKEKREREGERERPCSPSRERPSLRGREEREERERENEDVDKTWQLRGGRNNKTVHLSENADVVPQSGHRKRSCHNLDLKRKVVPL